MKAALLVLAVVVVFGTGFWAGRLFGDSGSKRAVTLAEEMVLLGADGAADGTVPAGAVLYLVSDPFADRHSR